MQSELIEKTERLERMLTSKGLGGVLLNAQHNFAWLTGGSSNGIDASREAGAASILVTANGKRFILANNIEMPRMLAEEVSVSDFQPVEYNWQDEKASAGFVLEKARSLVAGEVASESAIESEIAGCRYRLTAAEKDRYRVLGKDAAAAVRRAIDIASPGDTEIEIADKMRHELGLGGMVSVVTLVAADERILKFRHPVPSENRWKKTLLLVTCAKHRGLIASLSRMICAGEVPGDLQRKTEAAAYVNACLLDATRPGVTGANLYRTAANAYESRGFADEIGRHHQGGAAGYRTREWVAHPNSTEVVQHDQAFAWNPSITGTKVEETCIATENAVEIITASSNLPQITTSVNGTEYISPGILTL